MTRFSLLTGLACVALVVPGCSADTVFDDGNPQVVAAPDSVSLMLAEAADRASNALETLAAVESARSPGAQIGPVGDAPPELRRAVSVNWIGPVDQITKTLAARAGYEFLTIGATPVVPVVVSIDAENRPVIEILRDIGLQLGVRGDVKVDSRRRVVEIHYAPNTGISG